MIRAILTFLYCLIASTVLAQAPAWVRAGSAGSSLGNAFSIAAHNSGSIYVTGQFGGSSITFGNTNLNSAGSSDVFIVKYYEAGIVPAPPFIDQFALLYGRKTC